MKASGSRTWTGTAGESSPHCTEASVAELIRGTRLVVFDFDGVFTDNTVYVLPDGSEAVRCWRGDGIGLRALERAGVAALVLSTEVNPIVAVRCRKLGVRSIQGCADKREALDRVLREMGLSPERVAFVGNDTNDLACLAAVGLPIVVRDAHRDAAAVARYRTRARGGRGAVREVCDLFTRVLASARE